MTEFISSKEPRRFKIPTIYKDILKKSQEKKDAFQKFANGFVPKDAELKPCTSPNFEYCNIIDKGEKIGLFDPESHYISLRISEVPAWILNIAKALEEKDEIEVKIYLD